ncbi:calcium-binding protein [Oceaniglobus roseus]|uniref:calcium-binding protein n=1 Tax=Oceaniglobus roseus TaxID=1737570 RepID=UPI0015627046|nr:pre-peptidase C-terminal domain-containing protein [Kandeliimicrobium roseum]
MSIISGTGELSGTAGNDILVDYQGGNTTIYGDGGNDLIYADHDAFFTDETPGNNTLNTATNIDGSGFWSTFPNEDVGDTSVPYTTVVGEGNGTFDWFSVTVGAGQTLTLDIDYGSTFGPVLGGGSFDTYLRLYDAFGNLIASDDDSGTDSGGLGSVSSLDSFLTYTAIVEGTYYIEVSRYVQNPIPDGATYVMQASVTGHANTNAVSAGNDSVDGGEGDDRIYGFVGNDTLEGNFGSDTLLGGEGNDLLHGDIAGFTDADDGDNQLYGGAGDDTLEGGSTGDDRLFGEAGNDILRFGFGADTADGGSGDDRLVDTSGPGGGRVIDGGDGIDILDLNELTPAGETRISLFAGVVRNGNGFDSIANIENVYGSQGNDVINADTGANELRGNAGDDVLRGFDGNDTLAGGLDQDTILGGYGDDLLSGGDGDDSINGQVGEDTINGGAGNDTLLASFFDDTVNGGSGNDFIDGGALNDVLNGQGDNDTINGVTGNDVLSGGGGDDFLRGGAGIDTLDGDGGNDTLAGGDNSDLLRGGNGDDELQGQNGLDTLDGGNGNDTLIGGANADTFQFDVGSDRDLIRDFEDNRDVLALDQDLWGGGLTRQQVIDTYAFVNGSTVLLDFGTDELTLLNVNAQSLVDDIVFT